ncbi:hypothetical protein AB0M87_14670 [Streptomyces sp. NPDC051320]|uniref:hypothetical protein n=1 Tax=Streptomyces sp. NPDC051320 TaxID=3154644 RepID=UPI003421BF20
MEQPLELSAEDEKQAIKVLFKLLDEFAAEREAEQREQVQMDRGRVVPCHARDSLLVTAAPWFTLSET